jgi:DDE superfamily endonuclease
MDSKPRRPILQFFSRVDYNEYKAQAIHVLSSKEEESESKPQPKKRRGPGRPRKPPPPIELSMDIEKSKNASDEIATDALTVSQKRDYKDWWATPLIGEIIDTVLRFRSVHRAVKYLKEKYPPYSTEERGRYDDLSESTVSNWFDDNWKLKPQFALLIKAKNSGGRRSALDAYPDIAEKIKTRLTLLRDAGQALNRPLIRLIMLAIIQKDAPQLMENFKLSMTWVHDFLTNEMGWAWRRATTSKSLPLNWKDLGVNMLKRCAVVIAAIRNNAILKLHPSLMINMDQTGVHLVPKSNYTYEKRKKKEIAMIGEDDKRAITCVVASSANGDLLPLQLVWQGKTERCHPQVRSTDDAKVHERCNAAKWHLTHSQNHWSNIHTMQQYITKIIAPYIAEKIQQHQLPADSKAILMLDCWKVHTGDAFRDFMKASYPNIRLVFIPANCTSKLQIADVALNFPFKSGIRKRFQDWTLKQLSTLIDSSQPLDLSALFGMPTIKPLLLRWIYEVWDNMRLQQTYIMTSWKKLFELFDPFLLNNQLSAQDDVIGGRLELECDLGVEEENDDDAADDEEDIPNDENTAIRAVGDVLRLFGLQQQPVH